jgi:NADH-quinone oxidoreductase subunit L
VASWFYIREPACPAAGENQRPLYLFLLNKWYFDEIYDFLFVRPAQDGWAVLWKGGDGQRHRRRHQRARDGDHPLLHPLAGRAQSGYIFHYAFAMVLGIVVLITWMTLRAGG